MNADHNPNPNPVNEAAPFSSSSAPMRFEVEATDAGCGARAGRLWTRHGVVHTPAFMPVGTQATVKGLLPELVRGTGAEMVLANTYHLALRPGEDVVAELGGLHRFMGWDGPILTDSGGFQVFSMSDRAKMRESGVTFRSHIDGSLLELTPERAMSIQIALGADIAMCFDHCPALPASHDAIADAVFRTIRWATRCREAHAAADGTQALFGIVQGGSHEDLRTMCAERLTALDFPGYAVGGVSVGETRADVRKALAVSVTCLPADKPRYLMGVGRPEDLIDAVYHGIDLFDCVWPTRNGRNATCMTDQGAVRLRNAAHKRDPRPIEDGCLCLACRQFSRSYLRHLFLAKEMLGPILASLHNVAYLQRLVRRLREAIFRNEYVQLHRDALAASASEV